MEETFATLLKRSREHTEDPTTGRPYTQVRLGELLGVSDALISQWEKGVGAGSIDIANALPEIFPDITVADVLRSLGARLPTEMPGLMDDEREVLAEYRALKTPGSRRIARRLIRALRAEPDEMEYRPRRSGRPQLRIAEE